jgi:Protein of unknown function (DUF1592)/Protein of unknown function (DUF1588)/Protein of unknown function (DUF1595)/Protein of unknown function (DUF1587)/Protein of unknown function (DUF1585)
MRRSLQLSVVLALGCTGWIGEGGDNGSGEPPAPGGRQPPGPSLGNPPGGAGTTEEPGEAVFRRLTRVEYNNTVRDLLGDSSSPADAFPGDTQSANSGFGKGGLVAGVDAGRIFEATERLATEAVTKRLGTLLPCGTPPAAAADQSKCAQDFIAQFGRRAYRRPLAQEESAVLLELYEKQRTETRLDFPNAIRVVLSAMLMSPNFLYRWELAPKAAVRDGAFVRFNSYEMASRLSYLLWASMPDEGLFAAAAANKLSTPDQIEVEARRMLKDSKMVDTLAEFFVQWLDATGLPELRKSPELYRSFTPELAQAMMNETREFAGDLLMKGDGRLQTLLTSSKSFVDAGLAGVYKAPALTGTGFQPASLNEAQRAGILTQAAFLTVHAKADETNPIARGRTLVDRLLCRELPPIPDNIPDPRPPAEGVTTRERFADHGTNPCAFACHSVMDPLGFAFENYDAIGAWRTIDYGKPVDASGTVTIDGTPVVFNNAVELTRHLATSTEVQDCMARQWFRYALRKKERPGDEPSLRWAQDIFRKSEGDLRELIVSLTKTRSFTHRTASMGEILP